MNKASLEAAIDRLSVRELEVLRLLAKGGSNLQIAQKLQITLPTAKAHTSAIYRKLTVKNRVQAVLLFYQWLRYQNP